MTARVIPHTAKVVRAWLIAQVTPNQWQGRVVSRIDHIDLCTEVGSFVLVKDAVRASGWCRGLPIRVTREMPKEAVA